MKKTTLALFLLFLLALVLGPSPAAQDAGREGAADELETFVPTEKLPADSAISFPVDI